MMDARRYLTDDEKRIEVADWLGHRSTPGAQPPPDIAPHPGGYGYPDPDIFDLTDRLNDLPGVLTIQSCAGHLHPGEVPGETAMWSGQLWLRLSEPLLRAFFERGWDLLSHPTIERCWVILHPDLGYVVDIVFDGNNRGRLAESSEVILTFFGSLAGSA